MYDNEQYNGFGDGEGPFVAGALSGEHEDEGAEVTGEAGHDGEYPEIYSEMDRYEPELYEGPRHRGPRRRRPVRHAPGMDSGDDAVEARESPFLDEEEIVRDLSGQPMSGGEHRCTCGRRLHGAAPARKRPIPRQEHEGGNSRPTLSNGDRGQAVLDLRTSLSRLGFSPGSLDGIFGGKTESAVRQFQSSRGIGSDGVVGPITWGEIDKALVGAPPSSGTSPGTGTGSPNTGPQGSAAAIVAVARDEVNTPETGVNVNKYSSYFGRPPEAWCGDFVSWVHTKAGIPLNNASTVGILDYVKRIGRFYTSNPQPGDILIIDESMGDGKPASHVAIVETVHGSAFTTIDGNWSDKVSRVNRHTSDPEIVGYGRLWTSAGSTSTGSTGSTSGSTGSAAPACANVKATTTVNPYLSEFLAAAAKAGVPSSWAQNASLIQLVGHESSWKPSAKNPYSTAFGLFQFLKSTWSRLLPEVPYGSTDVTWQAVGGYRYIKAVYRDPDRAWAFWQATRCKNANIAPADLQKKARYWISKGYAGY